MEEKAVIDLGTNTFHLLVFSRQHASPITPIFKQRIFVKLAEEGIDQIGSNAADRAVAAMEEFAKILRQRSISEVTAFGTSALRKASNAHVLLRRIKDQTGIEVTVISGLQEARLIANGVESVLSGNEGVALIMDIGGGSVEFIITANSSLAWMVSLPIGVAVLFRDFHQHDPIHPDEEAALRSFLKRKLTIVSDELANHSVTRLIGASGTFDVISDLFSLPPENYVEARTELVSETLKKITKMSTAERLAHPAIPPSRVDMIVVAVILIQEVLALQRFRVVGISKYALKEGAALDI